MGISTPKHLKRLCTILTFIIGIATLLLQDCKAQVSGGQVFSFLRISPSARITALGGDNVSLLDGDALMTFRNPALLNDSMNSKVACNFINYIADVSAGNLIYARTYKGIGTFSGGMQYFSWGDFKGRDEFGNPTGNFGAADWALNLTAARDFGRLRYGSTIKVLHSSLANFSSWGLAMDFGGHYHHEKIQFSAGLAIRNLGTQFGGYGPGSTGQPLPLEITAGISQKLAKAPLRFNLTFTHLQQPTLVRDEPTKTVEYDLAGNPITPKRSTADEVFRHVVFGVEVLLSKHFHIRAAYNHRRMKELKTANQNLSISGFSFGAGLRINRFFIDYGYAPWHTSGGVHQFSLATFINSWLKAQPEANTNNTQQ